MEYGYLERNNKGLYLNRNGKFYFVDRSCKLHLDVGLCKYTITKEFDKYGFIYAKNVKSGTIEEALGTGLVSLENLGSCYKFEGVHFWVDNSLFKDSLYMLVDDELVSMNIKYILDYRWRWERVNTTKLIVNEALKSEGIISDSEMLDIITIALTSFRTIETKDNRFFRLTDKWGCESYIVILNGKAMRVSSLDSNIFTQCRDITDMVENFIIQKNLVLYGYFYSDGFVHKAIRGTDFTRIFLPTSEYTPERYESCKEELEKNKAECESLRKRIAKSVTKNSLDALSAFNTKNFQLGRSL